ncbi:MAG: peroxide stress protein YaaA [Saprospiraceae bacterium]|nr:peroxide stress protein YaaA [Saprospiraceae bacterium]
MITLLSPAKTLDLDPVATANHSVPRLMADTESLVAVLKKKSARQLKNLMKVSDNIAALNVERYQSFATPFTPENAKPAALAFKGDVYLGLEAETFSAEEMEFAQDHIRILSGLYGVLKPLDLMQAYRLEMGTPLKKGRKKNLYEFWDRRITDLINADLNESGGDTIINLASKEYFHAVKPALLQGRLINLHFRENRNGQYKVISFNAKKARGRMAHLIVKERVTLAEDLKELVANDYCFNEGMSTESDWVYTID